MKTTPPLEFPLGIDLSLNIFEGPIRGTGVGTFGDEGQLFSCNLLSWLITMVGEKSSRQIRPDFTEV